jgi:hypothetical protein
MQQLKVWVICILAICLVAMTLPAQTQTAAPAQAKQAIYLYDAQWSVPRAQWPDMEKLDDQNRALMDKLLADGTIINYGAYSNLIHQEGEPTHGTWFTATSEGNLLKALEAVYAQRPQVLAPVQAASKHWDQIFTSEVYGQKSGQSGGYLTWSQWQVKPGEMRSYTDLTKSVLVPVLDKLLAAGTITSYGLLTEDYHQQPIGTIYEYFTVPDAASLDKANKALEDVFAANTALGAANRSMTNREGHRDFLTRLRYMNNK